jgi:hypothetical protein
VNNECIPLKSAAYTQVITVHCTAGVTGKKFVAVLTGRQSGGLGGLATDPLAAGDGSDYIIAGPPAAAAAVGGIAMWDVGAGGKAPILRGQGTVVPITAGAGGVTAGVEVQVDATGAVVPFSAGIKVGRALTAAAAAADAEVELY